MREFRAIEIAFALISKGEFPGQVFTLGVMLYVSPFALVIKAQNGKRRYESSYELLNPRTSSTARK